jgi:membrane glycosyltransferase
MGPLTDTSQVPVAENLRGIALLPPDTPLAMSAQTLRPFKQPSRVTGPRKSVALRRLYIFVGTCTMTAAGSYEMYEVLKVGGVTVLEATVLALFVLLFAWIAFSFMSTLAGFAVLLFRMRDPLGIDPAAPLPTLTSRTAMLLPTYNEDPDRITARLRAVHESVGEAGHASQFDWYVLSDTTDP